MFIEFVFGARNRIQSESVLLQLLYLEETVLKIIYLTIKYAKLLFVKIEHAWFNYLLL